jgi:hypothetical protein
MNRSLNCKRQLENLITPYKEIKKYLINKAKQTTITQFFSPAAEKNIMQHQQQILLKKCSQHSSRLNRSLVPLLSPVLMQSKIYFAMTEAARRILFLDFQRACD